MAKKDDAPKKKNPKKKKSQNNLETDIISSLEKYLPIHGHTFSQYKNQEKWKKSDGEESPKEPQKGYTRLEMLSPLDEVFIDDFLKDEIVTRTAVPNLLEGTEPSYNGVILYGPPGTGKTVLGKAIQEVYHRAGAYAKEVSLAQLNDCYVGSFARNLEEEIQKALNEAKKCGKPSFLLVDEGSILAQAAAEGANTVSKHYQEALDILKKYLGNQRELVLTITTNLLPESFEEALVREGRLTTYFVGHPDHKQRQRMWQHFARKYEILSLKDKEAAQLAGLIPQEQGAFIEEFCRTYQGQRRKEILCQKGFSTLVEALKQGQTVSKEEIKRSINYPRLREDIVSALKAKCSRNGESKQGIGFRQ